MNIKIEKLTVSRDKIKILDEIDLVINPCEFVAVVGANGAGKSTLLETIAGDLPYLSGRILFNERDLKKWRPTELARCRAVMRQNSNLGLHFTVQEVVLMARAPHIHRHETLDDLRIIKEALAVVGLSGFEDRIYTRLSGGECRRVHLARVLTQVWSPALVDPEYSGEYVSSALLLDEPTANLDVQAQHQVLRCAKQFAKVGGIVFCVLHDMNLAAQYADRVLILNHGQICADGPPKEVFTPELLKSAFYVDSWVFKPDELSHPVIVTEPVHSTSLLQNNT